MTIAREYTVKSFKSGNSVAFRLPKALGIAEGEDFVIVPHDSDNFSLWKKSDSKKVFMALYGSMSPGFMSEGRQDTDDR